VHRREYYVLYKDNISAAKVYGSFVSSQVFSLRPRGSIPVEFGSWLSKLCADNPSPYPMPLGSQWLTLMSPAFVRGRQNELRPQTRKSKDPGAIPKPIPPIPPPPHVVVPSVQHTNNVHEDSSASPVRLLLHLLFPDNSSHPVESEMFAASQLLTQIELEFVPTQPDAAQEPNILNALGRAASLPDNWIPDDDLYGIRRRARRLLGMTGADRSESSATAPPAGNPRPANTGGIQFGDKDPVPLSEPIVKGELSFRNSPRVAPNWKPTAAKRRLGEGSGAYEGSNAVDCDRQPSKRGKLSPA